MAAPQHFRSALNGFNREDVVNYISYITNTHETQLGQLRSELADVREERDQLRGRPEPRENTEELEALKQQLEERTQRLQALEQEQSEKTARIQAMEQAQFEKDARIRELEQLLESRPAAAPAQPAPWAEELNAYRRAESVERRARERVNQMVDRANGALADASVRLEESTAEIARITQKVRADLELLQAAVGESQTALANTAVIIGAVRVDEE